MLRFGQQLFWQEQKLLPQPEPLRPQVWLQMQQQQNPKQSRLQRFFHDDLSFLIKVNFTHCMLDAHAAQSMCVNTTDQANTRRHYKKCKSLAPVHIS